MLVSDWPRENERGMRRGYVQSREPSRFRSAKSLSLPVGSWLVAKFVSVSALQSVGSVWILSLTIIPIDLGSKKAY